MAGARSNLYLLFPKRLFYPAAMNDKRTLPGRNRLLVTTALLGVVVAVPGCTNYKPVHWEAASALGGRAGPPGGAMMARSELSSGQHLVMPGDTVSHLAAQYGVSSAAIIRANNLQTPYHVYVGQVLNVPVPTSEPMAGTRVATTVGPLDPVIDTVTVRSLEPPPSGEVPAVQVTSLGLSAPAPARERTHVVQRGENASAIAERYGVRLSDLVEANGLARADHVIVGQSLRIPESEMSATPTLAASPVPAPASAEATRRAGTDVPPPLSGEGFLWPVEGRVIAGFGPMTEGRRNDGINIAASRGAPVRAAENGIVVYAGEELAGYGRMILMRHADGYLSTYAHNAALLVSVGDHVTRGQVIARVGDTGNVREPQLHFALREGRRPIDPIARLVEAPTTLASGN